MLKTENELNTGENKMNSSKKKLNQFIKQGVLFVIPAVFLLLPSTFEYGVNYQKEKTLDDAKEELDDAKKDLNELGVNPDILDLNEPYANEDYGPKDVRLLAFIRQIRPDILDKYKQEFDDQYGEGEANKALAINDWNEIADYTKKVSAHVQNKYYSGRSLPSSLRK